MQNRLCIGRQTIYNSHHTPGDELCPLCNVDQTPLHMFLECTLATNLNNTVKNVWLEIIGSFEDFTDQKYINITDAEKLFGIEIENNNYNNQLTQQTKDILSGFMQKFIYEAFKKHQFESQPLNEFEILQKWKYHMALSCNTILNRMRSDIKPYTMNWYFKKPTKIPKYCDESNFTNTFKHLLNFSFCSEQFNEQIELTSELLSESK